MRWQAVHRHQPSPGNDAGEPGAPFAEHLPANGRMHSVSGEQHVARDLLAVGEVQGDRIVRRCEPGAGDAGTHHIRPGRTHRFQQDAMKIASMRHPVRRAVALHRSNPEIEHAPGLPGGPQADFLAGGLADDPPHRRFQPERDQHACAVRSELHTRADLAQLRRLFEHLHVIAALQQRKRSGEAAQAGAGDQDARFHNEHPLPP